VIIARQQVDAVTTGRTDGKPPADRVIFEEQLRKSLKYLSYATVIFLSAKEGHGMSHVLKEVITVAAERRKRVTTGQMNRFLDKIDFQRAPVPMAKRIRIFLHDPKLRLRHPPLCSHRSPGAVALCLRALLETRFAPPLASRAPPSGSR